MSKSERAVLITGLIVLGQSSDIHYNKSNQNPTHLYRSSEEEILHMLLENNPETKGKFLPNYYERGRSGEKYPIDLYSPTLRFAIEVDGSQHSNNQSQIQRDKKRDKDLNSAGIKTVRIFSSEINNNPSGVLQIVLERLRNHIKGNQS